MRMNVQLNMLRFVRTDFLTSYPYFFSSVAFLLLHILYENLGNLTSPSGERPPFTKN